MNQKAHLTINFITKITEDDNWYSLQSEALVYSLEKKYGVKPEIGDALTIHTYNGPFGRIRGMDLNNKKIFWKTDKDLEDERNKSLIALQNDKEQKFKEQESEMDEDYNALPKCFQQRIDKFRIKNSNFRIRSI